MTNFFPFIVHFSDLLQALDKATEQVIELAKKKQIQDELDKDYYDSDSSDVSVSCPRPAPFAAASYFLLNLVLFRNKKLVIYILFISF